MLPYLMQAIPSDKSNINGVSFVNGKITLLFLTLVRCGFE
jgi:hypothetical protein